jgi:hypothetical protein
MPARSAPAALAHTPASRHDPGRLLTRGARAIQSLHPLQKETFMNQHFNLKSAVALCAMAVLPLAHAANMSRDDYKAGIDRIEATAKADKDACKAMNGNAKDVCMKEADGKEKIAKAELEYNRTGKADDQNKIAVVKADATYAVAKEKCDDLAGNPKDVCQKEAKAAHTKGVADAKMARQIGDARQDANKDKMDASYQAAAEKCDAMSGDAKDRCIAAAKAKHGKS